MGDRLRLAVGIFGNAASLSLYTAPILTMKRVIRKKSTEEFSSVPYIMTLLNCLVYTWYGLPIVSHMWENFPVVTINGVGILLQFIFLLIYFSFASHKAKIRVGGTLVGVMVVFAVTVGVSAVVFHDHHHRKIFVGSIGIVASVAMYASPLIAVKKVIETKSVEYMPFYLSFFSFLASSLWMAYGLLSHDFFLASPNMVGSPLGILQLLLYFKYKKRATVMNKWDAEQIQNHEGDTKPSHPHTLVELVLHGNDMNTNTNNSHN